MRTHRSIAEPIRGDATWEERWNSLDDGLIACWERGREKSIENPALASQAREGQLVVLPWKGGIEKATRKQRKFGTLYYLAMWQGLRGEDLSIEMDENTVLTCSVTGITVTFTVDQSKYSDE